MCIGMCATPVGQAIYGSLFEILKGKVFSLFFIVTVLVVLLAFAMKKPFSRLSALITKYYVAQQNCESMRKQGGFDRSELKGMDKLMISMLTKGLSAQKRRSAQDE